MCWEGTARDTAAMASSMHLFGKQCSTVEVKPEQGHGHPNFSSSLGLPLPLLLAEVRPLSSDGAVRF